MGNWAQDQLAASGAKSLPVASLTDAFGTANDTVADVTGTFSQTILNDNFQEMSTKINLILAALRAAGILGA